MLLRRSMVRLSFLRMGASPVRLLDVCLAFRCRFLRGSIVVACASSGASSPRAGRFFCRSSLRSSSYRARAYEVPSKLNEVAHVYSLGVGEVRCPSQAEWDEDWASSFGWAYTNVREDYTVLGPVVCAGALARGDCRRSCLATSARRPGARARGLPPSPLALPAKRGEGGVPGPRELQGRHAATGSDGCAGRGSLPLRAGVARLQGQALPAVPRSEVRDPALGSTDDDRMTAATATATLNAPGPARQPASHGGGDWLRYRERLREACFVVGMGQCRRSTSES